VRSPRSPAAKIDDALTPSQRRAVTARGNVLVMAGAGTGKTRTLVERCLHCLCEEQPEASLDEILVVTFTEAAAAEMKQRLRRALDAALDTRRSTLGQHLAAQLALFDAAHIGTLHRFCLKLVREHFYELGLDPQPVVLDEGEARLLANETLEEELQIHYAGENELAEAVQKLIQIYGGGRDEKIRALVLRLHHYAQTRPDAEGWLSRQLDNFSQSEPAEWRIWLLEAIEDWRAEWSPVLESLRAGNEKAVELTDIVRRLPKNFSRADAAGILERIVSADSHWPAKRKTVLREPLKDFFADSKFLVSLAAVKNGNDPLAEDWNWARGHMASLLQLAHNFSARFAARKRDDGVLDFHDLEQFALKLLWDFEADQPTPVAKRWREKIRFVFVDEYQDINAAQDKIIQALSRDASEAPPSGGSAGKSSEDGTPNAGNRFLVGDVKQSIYRFRLADPKIFRDYADAWRGKNGQTIPLAENFRSRESLLHFVNSVFGLLLRQEVGGVGYDAEAQLQFGSPETRGVLSLAGNSSPRAELFLRLKKTGRGEASFENETGADGLADLEESEKEARLLALRLKELKEARHEIWHAEQMAFRQVEWRDMAVLLRSPANKAEAYAKEFERAGVPLVVERSGFFESAEILDLLSLMQLLDNPLQDVPCIAVLRSPLVGLALHELAEIRLTAKEVHFWTALNRTRSAECKVRNELHQKIENFLGRFSRWRKMARQISLSQCLEEILAETYYAEWLPSRPRGALRQAKVERLLNLARRFDQFRRQGLFRFLKFIEAQREAGVEPEVAGTADENAVRLMSIHQSKGLEFPVVAVADLAKPFNLQDLRAEIILDERFGLCPRVQPPRNQMSGRYPSLPHWLARRHQRRELLGEELRLLYVAMTRARDTLILSGTVTENKWQTLWAGPGAAAPREILAAKCCADWLGLWFGVRSSESGVRNATEGEFAHLRWRLMKDEVPAARAECGKRKTEFEIYPLDDATAGKLRAMLAWEYPFAAATKHAAKSSVTALRRQAADEPDEEAKQVFPEHKFAGPPRRGGPPRIPNPELRTPKLSAAEAGSAHHKFLQHFALENASDVAALTAEAGRMEREKILSADERAALDLEAIADFWNSPPGKKIRAQAVNVRRELAFTAKFSPPELAEILGTKPEAGLENEFVVVQGVADLVVLLPEEIWLVDFKTDDLHTGDLPARTKIYAPQLKLYALALAKIYARPVSACWLHFLSLRRSVSID
jgi:ATP-dependent helicase/nuclease subunit A